MKTFIIEVIDNSRTEFVETLLSQLDGIRVKEKKKISSGKKKKVEAASGAKKNNLFASSFGMWKGRNIDSKKLRENAWRKH